MWSSFLLTSARWRWRLWLQWTGASVLGGAVSWLLTQQFYSAIYQYLHKTPLRDGSRLSRPFGESIERHLTV